jgi:ferredoxin
MRLMPSELSQMIEAEDYEAAENYHVMDCIECGCCDYVCPSQIPLTARFHAARLGMQLHDAERRRAVGAAGPPGPAPWLFEDTRAQVWGAQALLLGPEPVIGSQAVAVIHGPTGRSVWVLTDGVRPFKVQWPAPTAQAGRS